jgi:hypothetical protein
MKQIGDTLQKIKKCPVLLILLKKYLKKDFPIHVARLLEDAVL